MTKRRYTPTDAPNIQSGWANWFSSELRRIASSIGSLIDELETTGVSKGVFPAADNSIDLGKSAKAWKDIYTVNAVTVTSDLREKNVGADFTKEEIKVAEALCELPLLFTWKNGTDDQRHIGVGAQHVIETFRDHGLNPFDYGIVSKDEGGRLGVRYSELSQWQVVGLMSMHKHKK